MARRIIPSAALILAFAYVPALADVDQPSSDLRLAFAEILSPRGIELNMGTGTEENHAEPETESDDADTVEESVPLPKFDDAFVDTDAAIDGRSISELILGSPAFPPIEGLPDSVWKDKTCASCHAWTQETLCDQGKFYLKQGFGAVDRKEHPYGGAFKREVMHWADRGCE